jgi:glutamyl-tRNA synthetase
MAPSPTGEYHIGHIRTVLYNYAFAKKNKGKFIIRIEDTDKERFVEGATDRILDVIQDYGLSWDEGPRVGGKFGPYIQSERLDLYRKYADELVKKKAAYHCFCPPERLEELREKQRKQGLPVTKYDKKCLKISESKVKERLEAGDKSVIRLDVPKNKEISFADAVYGEVVVNSDALDDQILLKSDGFPLYHLAVVVDDHLMDVTHVMRGNDWLPSTPKHLLIYEAFGWELPTYAHLPNLKELGGDKKLSKRFGPVNALQFLEEGYLPEAVLNFLMLLGWNPGTEKEIYTLEEFIEEFSLERIHKTDLVAFDRDKFLWCNGEYIRGMSVDILHARTKEWAKKYGVSLPGEFLGKGGRVVLGLVQDRLKKLGELPELISYFYEEPEVDPKMLAKFVEERSRVGDILRSFREVFEAQEDWRAQSLDEISHKLLKEKKYEPKEAFMTLRVAVSGALGTPPIDEVLVVLGKKTVLRRVDSALDLIDSK